MKFIVLLRGMLILSISTASPKLTHAQGGCRVGCPGPESTDCIGNFDASLSSSCTICCTYEMQFEMDAMDVHCSDLHVFSLSLFSLVDDGSGSAFECNLPICGDPCADSNNDPVDDICFGTDGSCTKCT